jgi:hypothetical protein
LACVTPFLDDFQRHWPTDEGIYVDFVREGICGNGAARMGNARWRRLTEQRAGGAKSVFHFDVQGSVAKSTHADLESTLAQVEGWILGRHDAYCIAAWLSRADRDGSADRRGGT